MKRFWSVLETLCFWLVVLAIGCVLVGRVAPQYGVGVAVVKTGSMEPTIRTGSLILVLQQPDYQTGDIITAERAHGVIVTHRVTTRLGSGDAVQYRTKGDHNNAEDQWLIPRTQVLGRVVVVLPWLGYLVAWSTTRVGILLLVVVPALGLGFLQGRLLYHAWRSRGVVDASD